MAKKATTATSSHGERRASWKGNLRFGLVSFAVEAINAVNRQGGDIHFHQLHAKCHSRIQYQKICPVHGKVSGDEIVSGYEYTKGKYVEIQAGELEQLETENDRSLVVDAFITPDTIDARYFDGRMYYLVPAEAGANEAYLTLAAAMEKQNCYAVGQVVFSGKDQLVLVRSIASVLSMAMLNYEAEIMAPDEFTLDSKPPASSSRQVKMAESLIKDWRESNFDFSNYTDRYRERVQGLIDAKVKGKKIVAPKEEKATPVTVNLMDALRKSLGKGGPKKTPATKAHSRHSA